MCNKCESAVSRNAELKENLIGIKCGYRHQKFHHRKLPAHLSSICQSIVMKYFQSIFDIRSGRRRVTSSTEKMCTMKTISSFNVLLFVIFLSVLLVPNMVKCTVLEEFGQSLQRSLGNVEIEDITSEYNNIRKERDTKSREGRQFQDDAFVAPNPFNLQPQVQTQTQGPQFRDISGGGGGFNSFANQVNSNIGGSAPSAAAAWPLSSSADMPKINNIQVQCEKTHIRVNVDFDRPFFGVIFSKGHYSDPNCVHLQAGSGSMSTSFEVQLNQCGTVSSGNTNANGQPNPAGSYVESTIIVQYDPLVQEVFDQARKLRCTWYDYYEKSVTFRPFQVNMLNAVTANFLGDNLQCWMQIQSGKGPWSSEVSGIVKIGQTMTMVLGIKDEDQKFDMIVRNCVAHDGKRTPIQLVNEMGCVIRPKIMSKFNKIKNFGSSASVVSYAYFQAFKFPDSMNVHFQCVIQVCRFNCPDPVCPDSKAATIENRAQPAQSVTSYAGPSFTTARSFVVPQQQGGQVSQALPPVLQQPRSPQLNQVLPPQVLQQQQLGQIGQQQQLGQIGQQQQIGPQALPPGLLPNQINIATRPNRPNPPLGGRRRQGGPRPPSARVDPRTLQRQKQHQIQSRQGRVEDFQQTLLKEYVDFTTQAPKAPFDGINIKIKQKQEPNNIFDGLDSEQRYYLQRSRAKRSDESDLEYANNSITLVVKTSSDLQVLSPDDVAFRLNTRNSAASNQSMANDIPDEDFLSADMKEEKTTEAEGTSTRPTVCVTLTNTSGLLFIVFFCIIVASLISCVISCLRRKQSVTDKKGSNANTLSPEDTKKMMIKLKDLQAQQQKQQEKSKQSIHDPMPSSILHPQQNPTSSKVNLNTALLLGEQQPPNISMISDMLPHDYSSSTNKSNGKNSNPKIKQRKESNNEKETKSKTKKNDDFLDLLNGSEDINEERMKNNNNKKNKKRC